MNYHIIIQDKFFTQYIEDIYSLHLESNNVFWVMGEDYGFEFFKTDKPVIFLGERDYKLPKLLQKITQDDKLFINAYTLSIAEMVINAHVACKVYVQVMGKEFYNEPWPLFANFVYDKLTYKKLRELGYIRDLRYKRPNMTWGKHIWKCIKWPFHKWLIYIRKQRVMSRIDYISTSQEELRLLKKLYPKLHAEIRYLGFDQNVDEAAKMPLKEIVQSDYKLLIGNSADVSNNHLDMFAFLKQHLNETSQIYSILSYGGNNGIDWIIDNGYRCFGNDFHPITAFMPRKEYLSFIQDIDIVIMFHNRQQAFGNIVTSICMGKPVFIKKENVIYEVLRNVGIEEGLYDVSAIGNKKLSDFIKETQLARSRNVDILRQEYSITKRLNQYKLFFN